MGSAEIDTLPGNARALVSSLLVPNATSRKSVSDAAADPFFSGMDVFTLYRRPRGPSVASASAPAAPPEDARWQKRQYSKIWSVQPQAADYAPPPAATAGSSQVIAETSVERLCPFLED